MTGERRRTGWCVVTVAAVLVFLFFGAGTAYSLLTPDYDFADGELLGEAGILTGSLALAGFGLHRLHAPDRRLLAAVPDFGAWLPARDGTHGEGRVDLGAQAARLRRTARRATGIAAAWAALFAAGLAGVIAADRAAADLLVTGVRGEGTVLDVFDPARGSPSIRVRYPAPEVSRIEDIAVGSGHEYHVGEPVTVVYDPADPAHVRTTAEANGNPVLVDFGVVFLVTGFVALPVAATAALGWWRRARAVAATGWRIATVTAVPPGGRRADIEARYRDGSGIVLRCAPSLHDPGTPVRRRAWIGGWGRQLVVLFPPGRDRPGPRPFPVIAAGPRVQPISPVR
ncbi:DUF3592 domain-containing protein [Amycolatopsis sp. CA-126428]|uniref:DUF3592 domain-containing protein n=1 Tax=Amycolatopsis sp. CA-126428 TaxID=2073158 RepID=UPI000CD28078|nr:DUF3592 domain-containing protein [Amycolatopsis sp. CA-126428]